MKAQVEKMELIDYGVFISSCKSLLFIELSNGAKLKIKYTNDDNNKSIRLEKAIEDGYLVLNFINASINGGIGTKEPDLIGVFNNTELYLTFSIYSIGPKDDDTKTININIYSNAIHGGKI